MSSFDQKLNRELDNGFKLLGTLAKVGWATGVSIGNSIHQGRLQKAIEQERARQVAIAEREAQEEKASKARIAKYEAIMLDMIENDLT